MGVRCLGAAAGAVRVVEERAGQRLGRAERSRRVMGVRCLGAAAGAVRYLGTEKALQTAEVIEAARSGASD